jgi:carbamoyl-phosphate synthase large subunit
VLACDSSASAPALSEADQALVVPTFENPRYFDTVLAICTTHQVRLLLSVNDLELAGLAENAAQFRDAGTVPLVSSPTIIARCQDKWAAYQWLSAQGIPTPRTFLSVESARRALADGAIRFPLIVKPRWGTSSIGVERVDNQRQLTLAHEWGQVQGSRSLVARLRRDEPGQSMLIQEWVEGQEYGLDIVNDLAGRHLGTLARRKLVMRAGNTDRAVTVQEPRLTQLGEAIGRRLGHVGSLDCDLIAGDRGLMVLDLNPRLGGGYPFSHLAGANLPALFLALVTGEAHDPAWLVAEPGVTSSRCDGVQVVARSLVPQTNGHSMNGRSVDKLTKDTAR